MPEPIFPEGELSVRPQERRIDMILRAGFAAGASQVLMRAGAPLALRIGPAFIRPGAHGLSVDFVELVAGEIVTPSEREGLAADEELEVEVGVSPFAPCTASVFLGAGKPSVLVRLPGVEVEREEAPVAKAEEIKPAPLILSTEGCRREIRDCILDCVRLHERRVAEAGAMKRKRPDPSDSLKEVAVTPLKWRDSRSRSRRLLDRLWVVTEKTEKDDNLEMMRAILREAVEIRGKMQSLKPELSAAPAPAPPVAGTAGFPPTGNALLDAGVQAGAQELQLEAGQPPMFLRTRTRPDHRDVVTRKDIEAVLATAWDVGESLDADEVAGEALDALRVQDPASLQVTFHVEILRKAQRMEVRIRFHYGRRPAPERPVVGARLPSPWGGEDAPAAR